MWNDDWVCLWGPRLSWLLTVKDPRHWAHWPAAGGGNGKTRKTCWCLPLARLWPSACRGWSSWEPAPKHPSSSGLRRQTPFRDEKGKENGSHSSCTLSRCIIKNIEREETLTVRLRCSTEDQVVARERLRDGANILSLGTLSIWMEQWVTLDANSARLDRQKVVALLGAHTA